MNHLHLQTMRFTIDIYGFYGLLSKFFIKHSHLRNRNTSATPPPRGFATRMRSSGRGEAMVDIVDVIMIHYNHIIIYVYSIIIYHCTMIWTMICIFMYIYIYTLYSVIMICNTSIIPV